MAFNNKSILLVADDLSLANQGGSKKENVKVNMELKGGKVQGLSNLFSFLFCYTHFITLSTLLQT